MENADFGQVFGRHAITKGNMRLHPVVRTWSSKDAQDFKEISHRNKAVARQQKILCVWEGSI